MVDTMGMEKDMKFTNMLKLLETLLCTMETTQQDMVYTHRSNNRPYHSNHRCKVFVVIIIVLRHQVEVIQKNLKESLWQGFAAALAVLVTGASQSRQHDKSELDKSYKSPIAELFDVESERIYIFTVNTKEYHSDVLENITRIMRICTELFRKKNFRISSNLVIACVNLRVLELVDVHISEEVLHNLLSTSKLLEKINLQFLKGLKKIKVSNLCYLQELKVAPRRYKDILEIHDVPSLRSFLYEASRIIWMPVCVLSSVPSIGNLRELNIDGVCMDDAFLNVINSDFPLLESLTLDIDICDVEIMDITCVTLKRLKIRLMVLDNQQVQNYLFSVMNASHGPLSCFQPLLLRKLSYVWN
ncbi:F-box protein-like protein [Tanacetum coccineum]